MINILFYCSFVSLIMGFLQFYYPGRVTNNSYISGRFDPPTIQVVEMRPDPDVWQSFMIQRPDGQRVFRPFGLTDAPGGACGAASNCCLIAMVWIIRRGSLLKKLAYCAVALMSMSMLYLCQVRVIYLITLGGMVLLGVSLFLRRDFRSLTVLATIGLAIFTAALAWAIRNGGEEIMRRFEALLEKSSTEVYADNRGRFLQSTLDQYIWEYPLGAGLGHWGMMNVYFGNKQTSLYSEIQITAWVFDGGLPLLFGYTIAALLAGWHVFRIFSVHPRPGVLQERLHHCGHGDGNPGFRAFRNAVHRSARPSILADPGRGDRGGCPGDAGSFEARPPPFSRSGSFMTTADLKKGDTRPHGRMRLAAWNFGTNVLFLIVTTTIAWSRPPC